MATSGVEVRAIRRGARRPSAEWESLRDPERHVELAEACQAAARGLVVFSHETAAALHGIPVIGKWPTRAHATVRPGHDQSNGSIIRTERRLDPRDVVASPRGLLATSPTRTAVDLAATRGVLDGMIAFSHLRRHAGIAIADCRTTIDGAGRIAGIRRVREALARSTAGSDSPLESLVVARCQEYGFQVPEQQRRVVIEGRVYFVDFAWDDGAILGEADGYLKYGDERFRAGRTAEEVVYEEKRREDQLRTRCRTFLRFSWDDAWAGHPLHLALMRARVPNAYRTPSFAQGVEARKGREITLSRREIP